VQSRDCANILCSLEIGIQFPYSENAQCNLDIVQIPRLRGTHPVTYKKGLMWKKYAEWGCIMNCLMLSSLPFFNLLFTVQLNFLTCYDYKLRFSCTIISCMSTLSLHHRVYRLNVRCSYGDNWKLSGDCYNGQEISWMYLHWLHQHVYLQSGTSYVIWKTDAMTHVYMYTTIASITFSNSPKLGALCSVNSLTILEVKNFHVNRNILHHMYRHAVCTLLGLQRKENNLKALVTTSNNFFTKPDQLQSLPNVLSTKPLILSTSRFMHGCGLCLK